MYSPQHSRPPEESQPPHAPGLEATRQLLCRAALVAACLALALPALSADRIVIQGQASAEGWQTGDQSLLLSRNEGEPAAQGRLRLWLAGQIAPGLQGMILGRFEDGEAAEYVTSQSSNVELEQAWIRWNLPVSMPLVTQAGRMPQPIGGYSRRYLPHQNPLIGAPAVYDIAYPVAVQLTGSAGIADFTVGVNDQPLGKQIWLHGATGVPRPALAAGVTPFTGFRIGAYGTWGPYLSDRIQKHIPSGHTWDEYDQSVIGFDVSFSRGHFELFAEMTRSLYEMPGDTDERGVVWYIEPRYTWSPRWFTALRIERNHQASVWFPDPGTSIWYITDEDSWDIEAGGGFRITPGALLKASYRVERATEYPIYETQIDHAIALQFAYSFDVTSWIEGKE